MRTLARALLVLGLFWLPLASHASAQSSSDRAVRLHFAGTVGVTAAFEENTALAAVGVDARLFAPEGLGAILRLGYEGLLFVNFGTLDGALAYRAELPGGEWAGLGLSLGLGLSAMLRDSVYQFTGDDVAVALFGTVGLDVRLGSFLVGLDVIGRWQMTAEPMHRAPLLRNDGWAELGGVVRVGGEVRL